MFSKKTRDLYQDIIIKSDSLEDIDDKYYNCLKCDAFLSVTELKKNKYKIVINFSNN